MKKKDLFSYVLFIFIICPYFFPTGLKVLFPFVNKLIIPWQIIGFLITIIYYLKSKKISFNILTIIIFCLFLIISTYLSNYGDLLNSISTSLSILTPCLLVDYMIKKDNNLVLNSFNLFFEIVVYLNFITILLYPNGMYISSITGYYENWILGYDNTHIFTILPAIMFSILKSYKAYNKINLRCIMFILVCTLSVLIRFSGTSVIAIFLILLYFLIYKLIDKAKFFNIKNYLIIYIMSFFGIVIFKIQNYLLNVIVNILDKDVTFTGRIYIWDYIIKYIKQKPILGYGIENSIYRYNKSYIWRSYHAHNEILEILYLGGFVLFIIFALIIRNMVKQLYKFKAYKESKILSWICFTAMIIMLTEVYNIHLLFLIIIIATNIEYIIQKEVKEVKDEN